MRKLIFIVSLKGLRTVSGRCERVLVISLCRSESRNPDLCGFAVVLFHCLSGDASEARGAELWRPRTREDSLFLLAGPPLQRQRERDLSSDDGGVGQPPGLTSGFSSSPTHDTGSIVFTQTCRYFKYQVRYFHFQQLNYFNCYIH